MLLTKILFVQFYFLTLSISLTSAFVTAMRCWNSSRASSLWINGSEFHRRQREAILLLRHERRPSSLHLFQQQEQRQLRQRVQFILELVTGEFFFHQSLRSSQGIVISIFLLCWWRPIFLSSIFIVKSDRLLQIISIVSEAVRHDRTPPKQLCSEA